MDKMIAFINKNYNYNTTIQYSTPSEYLDAVHSINPKWPTRYSDMLPYADIPEDYWTGYFSSRPNAKKQVRDGSSFFHASSKVMSIKAID